jgi:hypothetical protein
MTGKGIVLQVFGLLLLTMSAATAVIWSIGDNHRRPAQSQEFHHLVGGLGTGPAVDLSSCPFSFDARLANGCRSDQGPIPGGVSYCREHGCSLFSCAQLHDPQAEKASHHAVFH